MGTRDAAGRRPHGGPSGSGTARTALPSGGGRCGGTAATRATGRRCGCCPPPRPPAPRCAGSEPPTAASSCSWWGAGTGTRTRKGGTSPSPCGLRKVSVWSPHPAATPYVGPPTVKHPAAGGLSTPRDPWDLADGWRGSRHPSDPEGRVPVPTGHLAPTGPRRVGRGAPGPRGMGPGAPGPVTGGGGWRRADPIPQPRCCSPRCWWRWWRRRWRRGCCWWPRGAASPWSFTTAASSGASRESGSEPRGIR